MLFPRWGARRLARWYWLKVTADGQLAGGSPRSPHRKPWEPLLVGFIGSGTPPALPPHLADLMDRPEKMHHTEATADAVRDLVLARRRDA